MALTRPAARGVWRLRSTAGLLSGHDSSLWLLSISLLLSVRLLSVSLLRLLRSCFLIRVWWPQSRLLLRSARTRLCRPWTRFFRTFRWWWTYGWWTHGWRTFRWRPWRRTRWRTPLTCLLFVDLCPSGIKSIDDFLCSLQF